MSKKLFLLTFIFYSFFTLITTYKLNHLLYLQYNNFSELSERSNEFAQNPDYSDKTFNFAWGKFKFNNPKKYY